MNFNMGKPRDMQKTIEEWIDPAYAYANESPSKAAALQARASKLNPNLAGPRSTSRGRGQQRS